MEIRSGRALGRGEPIRVKTEGPGGMLTYFTFRGQGYHVRSVELCQERLGGGLFRDKGQQLLEVRTETGLRALLSRDPQLNRWRMVNIIA